MRNLEEYTDLKLETPKECYEQAVVDGIGSRVDGQLLEIVPVLLVLTVHNIQHTGHF